MQLYVRWLGDFGQRCGERLQSLINLQPRNDQRRLEPNHVSVYAANADQNALPQQRITNRFGFGRSWRLLFISYQLHTDHQAEATDFSDQRTIYLRLV